MRDLKTEVLIERLRKINPYIMLHFLTSLVGVVRPDTVTKEEIEKAMGAYSDHHLRDLRGILEQVLR